MNDRPHVTPDRLPSSRAEARELGSMFYFTGRKCWRGHIAPRYTVDCHCLDCNDIYFAQEHVKEQMREQVRRWEEANKEHAQAKARERYERNKEQINAKARERYRRKKAEAAAASNPTP